MQRLGAQQQLVQGLILIVHYCVVQMASASSARSGDKWPHRHHQHPVDPSLNFPSSTLKKIQPRNCANRCNSHPGVLCAKPQPKSLRSLRLLHVGHSSSSCSRRTSFVVSLLARLCFFAGQGGWMACRESEFPCHCPNILHVFCLNNPRRTL